MKPWFTPTPCHWSQGPSEKLTPTAGQRSCPEPRAQHTPGYCHSGRAKGFFQALAQPLWGQHSSLFGDFSFLICETETIIVSSSNVWGLNGKQAADVGSILGSGRSPEKEIATHFVFLPGKSHEQRSLVRGWGSMGSQRVERDLAT